MSVRDNIEDVDVDVDVEGEYNTPVMTLILTGDFTDICNAYLNVDEKDWNSDEYNRLRFSIDRTLAERLVTEIEKYF